MRQKSLLFFLRFPKEMIQLFQLLPMAFDGPSVGLLFWKFLIERPAKKNLLYDSLIQLI